LRGTVVTTGTNNTDGDTADTNLTGQSTNIDTEQASETLDKVALGILDGITYFQENLIQLVNR